MTDFISHHSMMRAMPKAEASLKFGRFRVLPRQRLLLADGVPTAVGTRAFELLLALLEADGSLVTKAELLARVWPGVVVEEMNLKVQVSALRKALGEARDFIRTEHGRGYRFTAAVHSTGAPSACRRPNRLRRQSTQRLFPRRSTRRQSHGWSVEDDKFAHANRWTKQAEKTASRAVHTCRNQTVET